MTDDRGLTADQLSVTLSQPAVAVGDGAAGGEVTVTVKAVAALSHPVADLTYKLAL